ncbi:YlbF family regulator [Tepidibacillus marianensis]|uniref:YlbF family regulator n=1 Tax=Tepidibacillus marianensis TaxID=3131995 RepID=UPI0030D3B298
MANIYDKAYDLAKEIEKDENYLIVKQVSQKVMKDPEKSKQLDEFRFQQYQIQRTQMQGDPVKPEDMEETNRLYEELTKDVELKMLLDAELHLSTLFADINRILTGPLEKVYKKE